MIFRAAMAALAVVIILLLIWVLTNLNDLTSLP